MNRCCLFHDWQRWSAPKIGEALWEGKPTGDLVYQERACARCGLVQMREVAR